jgi:Tfp pilus assembly protein PilF
MLSRLALLAAVVLVLAAPPAFADARADAKAQVTFGISVAQKGLWKEALYRFEKAVEIDPTYAAAHNNRAIALEHEGKFREAERAYERALELEPDNVMIRQNFDLFRELNERAKSRTGR